MGSYGGLWSVMRVMVGYEELWWVMRGYGGL